MIKPIGSNVLVKVTHHQDGDSVILTPETALIKFKPAKVLAIGTGRTGFDSELEVDDIVGIDVSMSVPVSWDGEQDNRYVVDEPDILCKIHDL